MEWMLGGHTSSPATIVAGSPLSPPSPGLSHSALNALLTLTQLLTYFLKFKESRWRSCKYANVSESQHYQSWERSIFRTQAGRIIVVVAWRGPSRLRDETES